MSTSFIVIIFDNHIYKIDKEPFETDENTYKRGLFIIKNFKSFHNNDELISKSIMYLNEQKNKMIYN